jgi:hypothetical protein
MSFVIATNSRTDDELLFMVDRSKQRASFWSNRLCDVLTYQNRDAAQRKASSLKFNRPQVMTLTEARAINEESERQRDHESAMDSSEAGWDGHKGVF